MTYGAIDVARYIIMRCNQMNKTISNLKLQKILYFVQAEFLVDRDEPCFSETIEAWDFGPVIPSVYHKYKVFGSASIPHITRKESCTINSKDKDLIDGIVDECAKYSASVLVEITHNQTPWKNAYQPYCNAPIPNESIKQFFKEA